MNGFFVTGIDTNVGKTVIAAMLVEALQADYWKPVQAGNLDFTDSDFIREYTMHGQTIHPEVYTLPDAVSPHLAAKLDNKHIDLQSLKPSRTNNCMIVEGAGGVFAPLTESATVKDLIIQMQLPVIIVSKNYLGSINHTLLTIEGLKHPQINIAGIIFNGESNIESEDYILHYSRLRLLGKIPKADLVSKGFIIQHAEELRKTVSPFLAPIQNEQPSADLPIDYESF